MKGLVFRMVVALCIVVSAGCSMETTNEFVGAALNGDLSKVSKMMSQGVDINSRAFDDGQTALIAACRGGHLDLVKFLADNGADLNLKDAGGTPLYWAAFSGSDAAYRFLRGRGARLNADDAKVSRLLLVMKEKHLDDLAAEVRATVARERN